MDHAEERVRAIEEKDRANGQAETDSEEEAWVDEASRLPATLIYETIRRNGVEEMTRPRISLIFSGFAAGILMSFSVLGEAVFHLGLPDAPWRFVVASLGYSLGFLLVIKGRMQLFTENTITTVLPLMSKPCREHVYLTARLWGIVLVANVAGAFTAATFYTVTGAISADLMHAMVAVSAEATAISPWHAFVSAMPAGVLVAALVWMLPTTPQNNIALIVTFTWLIAAGGFSHVIAGSVEVSMVLLSGGMAPGDALFGFFFPVLLGNIAGGTAVFTLLAWAQVSHEVQD